MMKYIYALILALCCTSYVQASEIKSMSGGMQGRPHHLMMYESGCTSCHGANPKESVTDQACVQCHGQIQSIKLDESKLPIPEANPHNSIHFAGGASCLACHAEHKQKPPLCSDCHTSWFEKM